MSRLRLLPIVLWFGVAVVLNVIAQVSLDDLATDPRPLVPATDDATLARIGQAFPGTGTDNTVDVVVGSNTVNSDEVRAYLAALKSRLEANAGAVRAVLDMSADSLTAPVTQSVDRSTTYLPVWLRGELGSEEGLASLTAVQTVADDMPRPAGLQLSWSGPAADANARLTASTHLSPWLVLAVMIGCILLVVLAARPAKAAMAVFLTSLGTLAIVFPLRKLGAPALAGNSTAATTALVVALTVGATFGCTQMLLSGYRYRRLRDDTAFTRSYWAAAAPVFGAAAVAASTLMAFALCALPRIDASGLWAGVSVLVCALVVLTTAPCYLGNVSGAQLPHNAFAATMSLRLRKPIYRWPQETLAVVAVIIVACGFQLAGLQPSVVEPEPHRAVNAANTSASQGFSGERMSPETVVITARKDLRTPVGLLAINEVTRQLMALPGVHMVQSGSWPGGLPWPDATLAHQIGEFNHQLQSGALSASPLTSSVAGLPDDMRQIISSLDRLEQIVDGLVDGLSSVTGSLEGLHASIAGLTETVAVLSGYADPVRRWVGSYANCAADPICSIGLKITEAVDSVLADTAQLTASSREVSDAAAAPTAIVSSFRTVITQMRPAIADMGELINGLAAAVTDLVPEVTRSTSFINLMTNDLSIADAGGFYLSQDRIDAESYSHARDTLFSADGRSTRLFVFTDAESAGVSGPTWLSL